MRRYTVPGSIVLTNIIKGELSKSTMLSGEHLNNCPECTDVIDDTVKAVIEFIKTELNIDLHKIRI